MALKYKKIFKVPDGFEDILNDFAKEILRNKPNDILDFGIWYFQGLENNQDPTKMDYPFKGTNLPEHFKSQGYQIPKIISAENKLSISNRDNLRLDKSMKKSTEINSTNVPLRDDLFRQQGKNDQIVENFGVENYHFVEEGIENNNEYKVHNNPADREFNINEVNGSGFNYKEGQFPNKIDDFEMGYNYRGGLKEKRNVKFPEMKKEGIILKGDDIKNVDEFIKTGGMATTEKKEEPKEKKEVKKKKEKVVKPPDFNTKDYDDRSSNFPDSNKDKIIEDTTSKLGINPDRTQNKFDDEKNDDDSSNAPDSNKDKIIQHTASMLNKKIITNEENFEENYGNEIRETNQENYVDESHNEFNSNVQVETSSEKYEITVVEKDGNRTVVIKKNGEEIGEDELPEEYKVQLENMKKHLNDDEQNIENVDENNNENVEEYNENVEQNNVNVDEQNNENVDENNNVNVDEEHNENNNENVEEYNENMEENNVNVDENNVNVDENNVNVDENKNDENIEENNNNLEENNVNNEEEHNENIEEHNENNENIEEYKENIEENNNNLEENINNENTNENNNINQANQNEDFIDENELPTNNENNNTENNKNQYAIETITETKTNENGEQTTEKRLIVTKNGVEIAKDEIPEDIQQQLNLIQQQIDEGKAKIETVENTGKIENTNKEIKSEINKEGEEEIIETTTKEVKELKDGQVVNEQKTVTTTTKKRKRRGENEEGLESDTDNEFGNGNEVEEEENVPAEEN